MILFPNILCCFKILNYLYEGIYYRKMGGLVISDILHFIEIKYCCLYLIFLNIQNVILIIYLWKKLSIMIKCSFFYPFSLLNSIYSQLSKHTTIFVDYQYIRHENRCVGISKTINIIGILDPLFGAEIYSENLDILIEKCIDRNCILGQDCENISRGEKNIYINAKTYQC